MVRNSTKRASSAGTTPASSPSAPSTSPATISASTNILPRRAPVTTTAATSTTNSNAHHERPSLSSMAPTSISPVAMKPTPTLVDLKVEPDGTKSFTCTACSTRVKVDVDRSPSEHICETESHIRVRKRLRGPPPYQYSNEEAAVGLPPIKKRGKKAAFVSLNEKKAVDAEKEAWLQREVLNKVYDPNDIWCRYCGCVQASGFSRGPWGSRKLCTVHYVQWQTKKSLDLSKWPKEPTEPINRLENTEFDYLRRMQAKGAKLGAETD